MELDNINAEEAMRALRIQQLTKEKEQQLSAQLGTAFAEGNLSPERRLKDAIEAFVTQDQATMDVIRSARMICTKPPDPKSERPVDYTKFNVLIQGASGTGKSLLARIIHGTVFGRFVEVNCAGLQDTLFESELFGHEKGAFTNAFRDREGLLVSAARGTAFIDEVGELSLAAQAKLLHAVENRRCYPVGADRPVDFSCRMVFATNKPLEAMVAAGTFREDLYHRISTFVLRIPPLDQRPRDVLNIAIAKIQAEDWTTLDEEEQKLLLEKVNLLTGGVRQLYNWLARRELLSVSLEEAIYGS